MAKKRLEPWVGLALSGGSFRTLFHCGSLWRLTELGGPQLTRISSVSGSEWLGLQPVYLEPRVGVRLDHHILYGKLLTSCPPHNRFRHYDSLFIRQRDSQRECFPWSHGEITGETPARTREIPDSALALEWSSIVGDSALDREAGEGHRGLARWCNLGGRVRNRTYRGYQK